MALAMVQEAAKMSSPASGGRSGKNVTSRGAIQYQQVSGGMVTTKNNMFAINSPQSNG